MFIKVLVFLQLLVLYTFDLIVSDKDLALSEFICEI